MKTWINHMWNAVSKRAAVAALAIALAAFFVTYESVRPLHAVAGATSNAAPLDTSKIEPLLTLDQAMETVAARVTPAIVNVAVTSRR